MKLIKYSPFYRSLVNPWWDDEDQWPELKVTEGLNVEETETDVTVTAAIPGIPADKVKITLEDGVLHISGKMEEVEHKKEGKKIVHRHEMVSTYDYTTVLPRPVDADKINAVVKDGILTVSAPIAPEAKAKEIKVSAR